MKYGEHKRKRQLEASQRQEYWNGLTTQQKIDSLDDRLGKEVGAKKQRKLLEK